MAEKKVLLDVEIKATEALKELASLKNRIANLKQAQKELGQVTEENRAEYEAYGQQIKALNTQALAYQKEIQKNIQTQNAQGGSLDELRSKLSLMNASYSKMSEEQRKSSQGQTLSKSILETTNALKAEEKALGDNRREVGNYALAGKSLRQEMRELTQTLTQMKLAGEDNTVEYGAMRDKLANLKDAMGDVSNETGSLAKDTSNLDALNQSLQGVAGAFGAYSSIIGLSAEGNEEFQKALQKMQVAITAIVSLTAMQNMLQKDSIVYQKVNLILQKLGLVQTTRAAAAETAWTAAKTSGNIATKAVAVAQWAWNAALAANPVVLVALGVAALVAGVYALVKAFDSSADAEKVAEKAQKNYEKVAQNTADKLETIEAKKIAQDKAAELRGRKEILQLKANGASKETIANKEAEIARNKRDIETKASQAIIKAKMEEIRANKRATEAALASLRAEDKGSKEFVEKQKIYFDLIRKNNALVGMVKDNINIVDSNALEDKEAEQEKKEAERQAQKDREEKYKQHQEKMLSIKLEAIERDKSIQEAQLELEYANQIEDFSTRQAYEEKLFKLQQDSERKKLELTKPKKQKDSEGNNTQEYQKYLDNIKILDLALLKFNQNQTKALENEYKRQKDLLSKSLEEEQSIIHDKWVKEKEEFAKRAKELYGSETSKEYIKETKAFNLNAAIQETKEIKELKRNSLAAQISEIEKQVNEQYAGDLQKYSDNEREKTKIEIAQLEESIKLKKEKGLSTYEDEAELRAAQTKLNQIALNTELLNENLTAQQKYELKKASIEAELELYRGNIDKEIELEAELAQAAKNYAQERINIFEEWAGKIMNLASELNNFTKALDDQELQEYEERNEQKKASYQEQLDGGIISKEQYDAKIAQSEQELDRKKAEIVRKQAIREKLLKAFEIAINTAAAIMKAAPNIALQVLTGITGAAQLATVMATPIPKASRGMLLKGNSHAQGGTLIEAEGGEAIINKRSTMMYTPLLSAINQAGGGVGFKSSIGIAAPPIFNDGGYVTRSMIRDNNEVLKKLDKLGQAIKEQNIYVAVEDIRREDKRFAKIKSRGNWQLATTKT